MKRLFVILSLLLFTLNIQAQQTKPITTDNIKEKLVFKLHFYSYIDKDQELGDDMLEFEDDNFLSITDKVVKISIPELRMSDSLLITKIVKERDSGLTFILQNDLRLYIGPLEQGENLYMIALSGEEGGIYLISSLLKV